MSPTKGAGRIAAPLLHSTLIGSLVVASLELAIPKSLRDIPTLGPVCPTVIEVVNSRVALLWINNLGDAFRISIVPSGIEDRGKTLGYRIAAGVYSREL
jgi:hypothetical protein